MYHHHREKSRSSSLKCHSDHVWYGSGKDQSSQYEDYFKIYFSSVAFKNTCYMCTSSRNGSLWKKLAFTYVDSLQWPHDSNLTITLLRNSLLDFQKNHPLPATLSFRQHFERKQNQICTLDFVLFWLSYVYLKKYLPLKIFIRIIMLTVPK